MADQTLVKTFTDIADAIREKDGSTGTMKPTEMPAKIKAIETGTDTSDATVTAADMPSGVIGYGKDGKVVGTVQEFKNGASSLRDRNSSLTTTDSTSFIFAQTENFASGSLFRPGSIYALSVPKSDFGNAGTYDVPYGITFTSSNGLNITGTAKIHRTIFHPVSGFSNDSISMPDSSGIIIDLASLRNGYLDICCGWPHNNYTGRTCTVRSLALTLVIPLADATGTSMHYVYRFLCVNDNDFFNNAHGDEWGVGCLEKWNGSVRQTRSYITIGPPSEITPSYTTGIGKYDYKFFRWSLTKSLPSDAISEPNGYTIGWGDLSISISST